MSVINGITFEKDLMDYFDKENVVSRVYRISKVNEKWFLSLISITELEPDYKAKAEITTILLSEPPFTELVAYLKEKNVIRFDPSDEDYWQDIILEFRDFGMYKSPTVFNQHLDSRCKKNNM